MGRSGLLVYSIVLVVFLVLLVQPPSLGATEGIPPEIVSAAQRGIGTFVKAPGAKHLDRFGFEGKKQIDEAALGQGFQIFSIPPEQLLNEQLSQSVTSLALPTNMWQFLIITNGAPVSLLTVDTLNGEWKAVSIGASGLATELGRVLETWPAAGYQYRLVRVYQAKSDFMEVLQGEKSLGIVPFTSGRIAIGLEEREFDPSDLYAPADIFAKLRPVVRQSVQ